MSKKLTAVLAGMLIASLIGFGVTFALAAAGVEPMSSIWIVSGLIGGFVTLGLMNLAGNKPVTLADEKTRAAALSLTPPPGTGLVIVLREGFVGKAQGMDVTLNGRELAQLKSPRFTATTVPPGQYVLKAAFAGQMNLGSAPGTATFDLGSGQVALFRLTTAMKMTTSDVVLTHLEDPAAVVRKLAKTKMVAATA
ncbi:hypothetical protein D3874_08415 [Oleomonas cavernae]|uniref:DUF2846 domain-containing protein n=1 Tax=Oleomonas cavernae TaxID=2320859 RepID=A0A418WAH5_9PROT|nr:hypothetical protein [Oleomonas cavernae]RJF87043.1 hypothetical protein D3874_08415 [Oleomonas cavernae]